MATAMDPALGLTGSLNAAQQAQKSNGLDSANMQASSQSMSDAAKSLQSVQGSVSSQTMAIQQMSMSSASQARSLEAAVTQLSSQIMLLSRSLSYQAPQFPTPQPMMPPPPPPPPMPSIPYMHNVDVSAEMRRYAGMAIGGSRVAGGFALRGMYGAGQKLGGVADYFTGGFFTPQTYGAAPGSLNPSFSSQASLADMAGVMATRINPEALRQTTAMAMREEARDRFRNNLTDKILGLGGGIASGVASAGGFMTGSKLIKMAGLTGVKGFAADMLIGSSIGNAALAPVSMSIGEIMDQAGAIRGFGEQYSRGLFRYGTGDMTRGVSRWAGRKDRQEVGRGLNAMSIDDLTYDQSDIRDIFAGAMKGDMMRGIKSTEDVITRVKEVKDTIKVIGQNMGKTITEASSILGEMQGLGFDPTGVKIRSAIFGSSSIIGMTQSEGGAFSRGVGQRYARQGIGAGMYGIAGLGASLGNYSVNNKVLSNADIAAAGGRAGVQELTATAMGNFLQSGVGKTMLMKGGTRGGDSFNYGNVETLKDIFKDRPVDQDVMMDVTSGSGVQARAFLKDKEKAMATLMSSIIGQANTLKSEAPGISYDSALRASVTDMTNLQGTDANAMMKMVKDYIPAMEAQSKLKMNTAVANASNLAENQAIIPRLKRGFSRVWRSTSEGTVAGAEDIVRPIGNLFNDMGDALSGREYHSVGNKLSLADTASFLGGTKTKISKRGRYYESLGSVYSNSDDRTFARNAMRGVTDSDVDADVKTYLARAKSATTSEDKMAAFSKAMYAATGTVIGVGSKGKNKALLEEFKERYGVDIESEVMLGAHQIEEEGEGAKFVYNDRLKTMANLLDVSKEEAANFMDTDLADFATMIGKGATNDELAPVIEKLKKKGLGKEVETIRGASSWLKSDKTLMGEIGYVAGQGAGYAGRDKARTRSKIVAKGIGNILKESGVSGSVTDKILGSSGALGLKQLIESPPEALKNSRKEGAKKLYDQLTSLKSIVGDIDDSKEAAAYSTAIGHEASIGEIDRYNSANAEGRKAAALLAANDFSLPDQVKKSVTTGSGGISDQQSQLLAVMMRQAEQQLRMSKLLIAKIQDSEQ